MKGKKRFKTGRRRSLGASILALILVFALALSTPSIDVSAANGDTKTEQEGGGFLDAVASFFGLGDEDDGKANDAEPRLLTEATLESDASTRDQWKNGMPTTEASTSTTGRVWTDKSVDTKDVTLTNEEGQAPITVENDENSFLVSLSALSSAAKISGTQMISKPLDIVLVLDVSGSMDDKIGRGPSKMDALKDAVDAFIDQTAGQNENIADDTQKHRISIVKFAGKSSDDIGNQKYTEGWGMFRDTYNYSQIVTDFQTDATSLKRTMSGIDADGGTSASLGLQHAERVMNGGQGLKGARADAQKVVLFFTDGEPNDNGSDWENPEASKTVSTAKELKDKGYTVFSVGVFEEADPSKSNDMNNFMNAVSSNYPAATYTQSGRNWKWNLGTRAEGNYYFAANDADSLKDVFKQIADKVTSEPQSPIQHSTIVGGQEAGYLTFKDQLGDYMQVKDFKAIVYANNKFEKKTSTTDKDGSITYTFEGTVDGNAVYKKGNLADLKITVTPSKDPNTGDTVKVEIPTTLIPLRLYTADVDENGNVTTDLTKAYPIRIFYTVGLKDKAEELLVSPDDAMEVYIKRNSDKNGNVSFYSNAFEKGKNTGDTTASFAPALTNEFYYFTQNTPLYNSENTDDPVTTDISPVGTYYYQRIYYEGNEAKTEWVARKGSDSELAAVNKDGNGGYYIPSGTKRVSRLNDFKANKENNITGTAKVAISPAWTESGFVVSLGNNGRMKKALPGSLDISKDVRWGNGTENENKAFTFKVDLTDDGKTLAGEYAYAVYTGNGTEAVDNGTIQSGGSLQLKDGQRAVISGLPAGAEYTVTETEEKGFTTEVGDQETTEAAGTIKANTSEKAAFTNTYSLTSVDLAAGTLKGTKTLEGRDWAEDETFAFTIAATDDSPKGTPLPENTTVVVKNNNYKGGDKAAFQFGKITYDKPGTYSYTIKEDGEKSDIAGNINASGAVYRVEVTVKDNGDGTLSTPTVEMKQTFTDNNQSVNPAEKADSADFINTFTGVDTTVVSFEGEKKLTDENTGGKPVEVNMFKFQLKGLNGAPMPANAKGDTITAQNDGNGKIGFDGIVYDINDVDKTYSYEITEIAGTADGIAYSKEVKTVTVAVRQGEKGIEAVVTQPEGGIVFTNTYRAKSVTYSDKISIQKEVNGRDAEAGQFTFSVKAADKTTETAIADGRITGFEESWTAPNTQAISNGEKQTITFPQEITFNGLSNPQGDTYRFNVTEVLPEGVDAANPTKDGWTYDTHTYTVEVKVTDNAGQLEASFAGVKGSSDTFVNTYKASAVYGDGGGLAVKKTLNGYDMKAGQFAFTITGKDEASSAKLTKTEDKAFTNPQNAKSGETVTMSKLNSLAFTQADAGKTFAYTVAETVPEKVPEGYTYDQEKAAVAIEVKDNGDGTLSTVTTVTKGGETKTYDSAKGQKAEVSFVNSYAAEKVTIGSGDFSFAKRIVGREWKDDDSFTFNMKGEEGAPMPETTEAVVTGKDVKEGIASFGFGNITFTKEDLGGAYEKTFTYEVQESQAGETVNGLTYDKRTAVVSVKVTDNGTGHLSAAVSISGIPTIEGNAGLFTNTYESGAVDVDNKVGLQIRKELTGWDMQEDQFTFIMDSTDEASLAKLPNGEPIEIHNAAAQRNDKNVSVDVQDLATELVFTLDDVGKTFTYQVKEADGGASGYDYDDHEYKVEFKVSDDKNGTLKVEVYVDGELVKTVSDTHVKALAADEPVVLTFKNTYKAKPAEIDGLTDLVVTKQLEGRDWQEGDSFTFKLEAGDDATKQAVTDKQITMPKNTTLAIGYENKEDNYQQAFDNITFHKAGTFKFTISEEASGIGGITIDPAKKTVTVKVTDIGSGHLTAKIVAEETDELTFVNKYAPGGDVILPEGSFKLTKTFTGKEWKDDSFTFVLEGIDGAPMPEQKEVTVNGPDEKGGDTAEFTFGKIQFKPDGTRKEYVYTYTVTEKAGENKGITYSQNTAKITVTVTDNLNGGYNVAVTKTENPNFVNTYGSGTVDVDGQIGLAIEKNLTGRAQEDGQFEFTMTGQDELSKEKLGGDKVFKNTAAALEGNKSTSVVTALTGLTFGLEDAGKTYTYTVSETKGGGEGYKNDETNYTVAFAVTDNGGGTLTVETSVNGKVVKSESMTRAAADPVTLVFNNSYETNPAVLGGEGKTALHATKTLTGRAQTEGEFKFTVKNAKSGEEAATGTNAAAADGQAGAVTFTDITYTTEQMNLDVQNGAASMETSKEGNVYTYDYVVAEDTASLDQGTTAKESSFTVQVKVTDDGKGNLTIQVVYPNGSDSLGFTNVYGEGASADVNLKGSKVLAGEEGANKPDIAGKYTFSITGSEGAPMPAKTTAVNDEAGNVDFGEVQYTMQNVFGDDGTAKADEAGTNADEANAGLADVQTTADDETADVTDEATDEADADAADGGKDMPAETETKAEAEVSADADTNTAVGSAGETDITALDTRAAKREKTFTYTITESGSVAGVTNDQASKTITVKVTDNGDGTISVAKTEDESGEALGTDFVFTNTYETNPTESSPTDGSLTVTKKLTGRDLKEGEFTFELRDSNNEGTVLAAAKNNADGSVVLPAVTFEQAGTYTMTLSEVKGEQGGITYDTTVYTLKAVVSDNGDGTLSVEWTAENEDGKAESVVFNNTYKAAETTAKLGAVKRLDGRELKKGEFTFVLKDGEGKVVSEGTNSAGGEVEFKELTFDKAGTYNYTISEVKGKDDTITYDDTVYKAVITVTDDGNGVLTAQTEGKQAIFTNKYTEPPKVEKPKDDTPKKEVPKNDGKAAARTGDTAPVGMLAFMMAGALLVIIAAVVLMMRRRRR